MSSAFLITFQYFYGSLIDLQIPFGFDIELKLLIKWFQSFQCLLNPAFNGRGGDGDVLPGKALFLPVEWQVIHVFIGQDHGQQPCSRNPFINYPFRKFSGFNSFSAFSGIFITDVATDEEAGRLTFQLFGYFFTNTID